jgi:hypothetical protein
MKEDAFASVAEADSEAAAGGKAKTAADSSVL